MFKLKGVYVSNYRSPKGNVVYVYNVSGSPAALAGYVAAAGDNLRRQGGEPTGAIMYFTTNWNGKNIGLIVTTNNRIVTDTAERDQAMSAIKDMASLPILQEKMAGLVAEKLVAKLFSGSNAAPVSTPVETPVETPADPKPADPIEEPAFAGATGSVDADGNPI